MPLPASTGLFPLVCMTGKFEYFLDLYKRHVVGPRNRHSLDSCEIMTSLDFVLGNFILSFVCFCFLVRNYVFDFYENKLDI